ncbi:hypothetical protein DL768_006746 [Monosporascus sp. mg162]|nr:hypothetical protein DL768_006746 [Monosporascus sp. mg162]
MLVGNWLWTLDIHRVRFSFRPRHGTGATAVAPVAGGKSGAVPDVGVMGYPSEHVRRSVALLHQGHFAVDEASDGRRIAGDEDRLRILEHG